MTTTSEPGDCAVCVAWLNRMFPHLDLRAVAADMGESLPRTRAKMLTAYHSYHSYHSERHDTPPPLG